LDDISGRAAWCTTRVVYLNLANRFYVWTNFVCFFCECLQKIGLGPWRTFREIRACVFF
jgi:hypothetical protein